MRKLATIDDLGDLTGQRVLLRCDFNVPMKDGLVSDASRLIASIETIRFLSQKGAKIIVLSHAGRPDGVVVAKYSLAQIAISFSKLINMPVVFASDCIGHPAASAISTLNNGDICILENTRFHKGEEENDQVFATKLAKLGDYFVNDAFSCCHRAHASTVAITHLLPSAAGLLLQKELTTLETVLKKPEKPVVAIIGGAKISTKLAIIENLIGKMDSIIIGGGMANSFLLALGYNIGNSLAEPSLTTTALNIINHAKNSSTKIILPRDAIIAKELSSMTTATAMVDDIPSDQMILDIGPQTIEDCRKVISSAKTILWNGPVGAFEYSPFSTGTQKIAEFVAIATKDNNALSVAGGGDTLAALNQAGLADDLSFVSTAGGAFLEWLENKPLPGVEALYKP